MSPMLSFYIYIAIFRHSTDKNENFGFAGLISCLNALYVDRVYQKCSPVSVMLHTTIKKKSWPCRHKTKRNFTLLTIGGILLFYKKKVHFAGLFQTVTVTIFQTK